MRLTTRERVEEAGEPAPKITELAKAWVASGKEDGVDGTDDGG